MMANCPSHFYAALEADDQEAKILDKHPMTEIPTKEQQTGHTLTMANLNFPTQTLTGQTGTVTDTQNLIQHNPQGMSDVQTTILRNNR